MTASRTIIVAGAGIGGLTAALALAARRFQVIILERTERLEEAGAGLQLSPNASRVLIELGVEPYLAPHVIVPDAVSIVSTRAAKEIGQIPLGTNAQSRYGAPYWIVRRADLQAALLACVENNSNIDLRLGAQVEDILTTPNGVTVIHRKNGARHEETAHALIGADGVWSTVRNRIFPQIQPQFTGRIAWRGIVETAQLPHEFDTRCVQLWMGPKAHLVAYPMSGGQRINVVAITSGTWDKLGRDKPGWSEPGDATEIAGHFSSPQWPPSARKVIDAVGDWRKWALFAMPDGGVWSNGCIGLLGDAAHAMLPFVAQGAGMAIEDAAVLAKCLGDQADITAALKQYGCLRAPRVERMQRTARRTGLIYHLTGPMAFARDQVIKMLGGQRLLSRQDWIYNWREV